MALTAKQVDAIRAAVRGAELAGEVAKVAGLVLGGWCGVASRCRHGQHLSVESNQLGTRQQVVVRR
jgi:hypothetical protein